MVSFRARGPVEVCPPLPQLHLQGEGSSAGSLFAGPLPGHGGCHRSRGGALSGVHRVGQSGEEDLPQTGARGETSATALPSSPVLVGLRQKLNLLLYLHLFHQTDLSIIQIFII